MATTEVPGWGIAQYESPMIVARMTSTKKALVVELADRTEEPKAFYWKLTKLQCAAILADFDTGAAKNNEYADSWKIQPKHFACKACERAANKAIDLAKCVGSLSGEHNDGEHGAKVSR